MWMNMQSELAKLKIQSDDFLEQNITEVVNYCRNPNKDKDGPWCFVGEDERETCYVPFCGMMYDNYY